VTQSTTCITKNRWNTS